MVSTSEVAASKVVLPLKISTPIKEMHYVAAVDDTKISKVPKVVKAGVKMHYA